MIFGIENNTQSKIIKKIKDNKISLLSIDIDYINSRFLKKLIRDRNIKSKIDRLFFVRYGNDVGYVVKDENGDKFIYFNSGAAYKILGKFSDEMITKRLKEIFPKTFNY